MPSVAYIVESPAGHCGVKSARLKKKNNNDRHGDETNRRRRRRRSYYYRLKRHRCARCRFDSCVRRNRLPAAATSTHAGARESARGVDDDDDDNRGGQLAQQLDAGDRSTICRARGLLLSSRGVRDDPT